MSSTIAFSGDTRFSTSSNNNTLNSTDGKALLEKAQLLPNTPKSTSRRNSIDAHLRRKVLIAYDNSVASSKMFEWALRDILRPDEDHIVLATVLDIQESTYIKAQFMKDDAAGRQSHGRRLSIVEQDEATLQLKPLVEKLVSKGMTAQVNVVKGDAKVKLTELASEVRADLVIIGSRGLGPIKKMIMGSVSDYIVHNCDCPVIVAREKAVEKAMTRQRKVSTGSQ
jgi:nucleotide-binding universal stress UspA family protein